MLGNIRPVFIMNPYFSNIPSNVVKVANSKPDISLHLNLETGNVTVLCLVASSSSSEGYLPIRVLNMQHTNSIELLITALTSLLDINRMYIHHYDKYKVVLKVRNKNK